MKIKFKKKIVLLKFLKVLKFNLKNIKFLKKNVLKFEFNIYTDFFIQIFNNFFDLFPEIIVFIIIFRNLFIYYVLAVIVIIFNFLNNIKNREFFAADIMFFIK